MIGKNSIHKYVASLALAISLLFVSISSQATTYTDLVIFGDSLSDTGNITALTTFLPQLPYATGRFSNGDVYTDVLADGLGLSSLHSLGGGTNYAFGGATIVPGLSGPPSLTDQSALHLAGNGGSAINTALYVVFGGGNDIRASTADTDAVTAADGVVSIVEDLITFGATNILIPNLPDLGATPEAMAGGGAGGDSTTRSTLFNTTLANGLDGLGALAIANGANIFELDVFSILTDIIDNPGLFGFTNTTDVCFEGATGVGGAGDVCTNPDEYVFWDAIHPTTAAHTAVGNEALALVAPVPVPAALVLMLSAMGLLPVIRRLQKA